MKRLLNTNKLFIATILMSFSHTAYSIPSLTTMVTGLSRTCASIVMPLVGLAPYNTSKITFCTHIGTIVEKPLQIDDKTRAKLKIKLAPEVDLDGYNKDIYLTADALGSSGSYIIAPGVTDRLDEKIRLRKRITLPVNAFQNSSVYPGAFSLTWNYASDTSPTGKITEESGELLTDEDLDMCCAYIKRDMQFEKSDLINKGFSKLPLTLALLPTVCTLPLYYADKKLTAGFAASITKSLVAVPARIAIAAGLGVALAGIGNVAAHRVYHYVEEEKDKYIHQKDILLFKKHLEATLKHVQSGKRVEYHPCSTWFDAYPRYRALVNGMQQKSLERRVKALAARSKVVGTN